MTDPGSRIPSYERTQSETLIATQTLAVEYRATERTQSETLITTQTLAVEYRATERTQRSGQADVDAAESPTISHLLTVD
ncbi:hypothetical protein NDU88_008947 [Pleurodeles waltl]|uniref:Uncharacterized protein n=1 Tax=Pleurodeles waltl TaxID=8319 RepID=A0AAV7N6F4_PLEWA|nr:hypothetical protein NDU88_008947 [Pleurodeles waltl]